MTRPAFAWHMHPVEVVLALAVLACVFATLVRLLRIASGHLVPESFSSAAEAHALTTSSDPRRRGLAVRAALRAALGWAGWLPVLAHIAVLSGGVLFFVGDDGLPSLSRRHQFDFGSKNQTLAWSLALALLRVAMGISIAVASAAAHAALLAFARRVTTLHVGATQIETASRSLVNEGVVHGTLYWCVAALLGPMFVTLSILFVCAGFYPTRGVDVVAGQCEPSAVELEIVDDAYVVRLASSRGTVASAPIASAASLVSADEPVVALHAADTVAHRTLIAVIDALREHKRIAICVPSGDGDGHPTGAHSSP